MPAINLRIVGLFHAVISGRCWLDGGGTEHRLLQTADVALVPGGEGHRLSCRLGIASSRCFRR